MPQSNAPTLTLRADEPFGRRCMKILAEALTVDLSMEDRARIAKAAEEFEAYEKEREK